MSRVWRKYLVAPDLVRATEIELKKFNTRTRNNEGFVYWAGRSAGHDCIALSVYRPRARVTPGSVEINEKENTRFIAWLRENDLTHVGQVHTHPPGIDVHSSGDDHWAFMKFPGLVSIVVPDYGLEGMQPLSRCAIHVFDGEEFLLLRGKELATRVSVLPLRGP